MNYKRFSEIPGLLKYFLLLSVTTLRTEMPKKSVDKSCYTLSRALQYNFFNFIVKQRKVTSTKFHFKGFAYMSIKQEKKSLVVLFLSQ